MRMTSKTPLRRKAVLNVSDAMVRATLVAGCVIAALAVSLTLASAQDQSKAREACKPDYQKFCSGMMPGGGRIKKCLVENRDALSAACKQVLDDMK
ncbi:conserved hypothetical protein [Rhodopseudomonas palustris HaA2]|uniref:Cysteine rich repeat protein n=1 Tax=Rhodopseudomonas palustris (strain HaA2) TaxID=316058 RepID=Q2IS46_RHOP2|nr:conserved hypothetical protein [Rhodopseudomonas palustris HaA2]